MTALVDDRIYPGEIPDDETPTPWLYYAVPETEPLDELDADTSDVRSEAEFHALADTYATAKAIIDAVRAVLDTYRGGQVRRAFWMGTAEETTEDGYHHVARFTVWWLTDAAAIPDPTPSGYTSGFSLYGIAFPFPVPG